MKSLFYYFTFFALSRCYLLNNKNRLGIGVPHTTVSNDVLPETEYFPQKLDHFNPTDETTWTQRYWRNSSFYKLNGPAFLMINGEAPASAEWAMSGQWMVYAKQNGAICFLIEHRYYGKSRPTNDTSTENLKYLSSEQALADFAYFIEGTNKKYKLPKETNWIVFGGSYAGSLAAWLRMKYPYLVHGAVSSSGPLLAKIDFHEYFEVVKDSLASYNEECVTEVHKANEQLSKLVSSVTGRKLVTKYFRLCRQLTNNSDDIASLFENLAGNFADVVQYNRDNRKSETANVTINVVCDIMIDKKSESESWQRYAQVNNVMLDTHNQNCLSYKYDEYLFDLQKTDWDSASASGRQWIYQTCTEFGFYQTSSSASDLFGPYFPIEFFTKQCKAIFGQRFDEQLLWYATRRTNILYGALDINVGNIIYVHGSVDPWHVLGINQAVRKPYDAVLITGTAHCADMYPSSIDDSGALQSARQRISADIKFWLDENVADTAHRPHSYRMKIKIAESEPKYEIFIDEA